MNRDIMEAFGFGDMVKDADNGNCPFCKSEIKFSDFKDDLSLREYQIFGLCQKCQDEFFGGEDNE